jgi:hypothetical protein
MLQPIIPDPGIITDETFEHAPGGAFEPDDLPDPPGMGFIRPDNRSHPAREGGLDLAAHADRKKRSRIPAADGRRQLPMLEL